MLQADQSVSIKTVQAKLLDLIGQISVPTREAAEIVLSDSLEKDLNVDSLSFIEMTIEIENTFGIEFDDDFLLMGAYPSVKTFLDYVEKKVGDLV